MTAFPSSDDVARALIAGCKETGDDPIRAASGFVGGPHGPNIRGRHYAMHALLHVFPDLGRVSAARMVGCPGHPKQFYNSSWNQIVRPRASGIGHMANWWNDEAYGRVIEAILPAATVTEETVIHPVKPEGWRDRELTMRRKPAVHFDVVTSDLMGDPPPGRSALDQKQQAST